jgi:hypothetical protein
MALQFHRSTSAPFQHVVGSSSPREKIRDLSLPSFSEWTPSDWTPATWVKVVNPPTAFAFNEALLLCQTSDNYWMVWIPDHGEILLHTDNFCNSAEV